VLSSSTILILLFSPKLLESTFLLGFDRLCNSRKFGIIGHSIAAYVLLPLTGIRGAPRPIHNRKTPKYTPQGRMSLIADCMYSSKEPNNNKQLLSVPKNTFPVSSHLTLQLQHPVQECFGCRRAPRNVNINRNNTITSSHDRIRVMIIPSSIRA